MNGPVVVVPCGGRKLDTAAPAGEMYTGSYHRAARRAAEVLAGAEGRVIILSALYGLIDLSEIIEPYELRAGQPGTVTGETLRAQAEALGLAGARAVVLGGRAYVELARQAWPNAEAPLEGTRGMGEQLARLAAIYKAEPVDWSESAAARQAQRQAEEIQREEARRAKFVTAGTVHVDRLGQASIRFDFPGTVLSRARARVSAALRFVTAYDVAAVQTDTFTLEALGAPEQLARFASALPRLLDLAENYTEISARSYGRWEHHSSTAKHMEELDPAAQRARARAFRAEAFEVVVTTLLTAEREIEVPDFDHAAPMWDQAAAVAGAQAEYGWVEVAEQFDAEEVDELLTAAVVEAPAAAPAPVPVSAPATARRTLITRRNPNDARQAADPRLEDDEHRGLPGVHGRIGHALERPDVLHRRALRRPGNRLHSRRVRQAAAPLG